MALADSIKVSDLKQNEMYAFIADQQTQGYGVASNSKWVSPLGNLYVTFAMSISKE
jgi:biotin-(acetyl-CoA carboxylase) ligase